MTQPSFDDVFRDLVDYALRPEFAPEMEKAMREYFGATRTVYRDCNDGDEVAFLEWLAFDRPLSDGGSYIEHYLDATGIHSGSDREDIASWAESYVSFFQVLALHDDGVRLGDILRRGRKTETFVFDSAGSSGLEPGELIMSRVVHWRGTLRFGGAINVFPRSARGALMDFLDGVRGRMRDGDWGRALKDVLPALSKFQSDVQFEDEPLFPGGYPEQMASHTVDTLVAHGRSCLERSEWTEALLCFQRALFEDPVNLAARNGVGIVHLNRGDFVQARRAFESIIATSPHHAPALLNLGSVYLSCGQLEEAKSRLIVARTLASETTVKAHACLNLGLVYLLLQEGSTALKYFREASRLTEEPPDAAALNFRIGSNLAAGEHWEAAATYLRKAVRLAPDFGEAHLALADVLLQAARPREAASEYRRALRLGVGGGRAWNALGKCYLMQSQYGKAEEVLRTSLELLPGLVEAHDNLGLAFRGQNRLDEARLRFELALHHAPRHVDALLHVGELTLQQQDYKTATRYARRALKVAPRHEGARLLLEQVERARCT